MQQARRQYDRKAYYVPIETLSVLLGKMAEGSATEQERTVAMRSLATFRSRYLQGNLSEKTAQRLGLIDEAENG